MDAARLITVIALTLFLVEGFALSVYPNQFKRLLEEVDPRVLQIVGLLETVLAAGLIAGIILL